jgi:D-arabinose 1-dehydrogenase-like Zn-dependent alcohol dehydrogenase
MPIAEYLSTLKHGGTFVLVGAPEGGAALKVQPFQLIRSK